MQNPIKAILAEDETYIRDLLRLLCAKSKIDIVAETQSGLDIIPYNEKYKPDLLILDIGLEDMSGIEVAMKLQKEHNELPQIIFVTGSLNPLNIMTAVNEIGAFYIVKPLQESHWDLAVSKAIEKIKAARIHKKQLAESSRLIDIHTSRKSYPIAEETILMVEKNSGRKTSNLYLTNSDIISSNSSLSQIIEQGSDLLFESIRGYLVNIRHVAGYKRESNSLDMVLRRYTIFFSNSSITTPLGRSQEKKFSERLNLFKNVN